MSYITLGRSQPIPGFNNYRLGSLRSQGNGSMFYNNSIYGSGLRVGNGSRFYNMGPVGTYVQFAEPPKPKDGIGKGLLNGLLASMIGFGPIGSFVAGWLSMNNNAEKAGNWISNLFKGNSNQA